MTQPRALVLGGTGFVGNHLLQQLSRAGWACTVPTRSRARHLSTGLIPGVELVEADVYSVERLTALAFGADAVVNLVGILNEPGSGGKGFDKAHVQLTRTAIEACRAAGVSRLIQMSALNAGKGRSHYLRTRGAAEALVEDSGLCWSILQPSVIFGPGDGLFCRFSGLLDLMPAMGLPCAGTRFAPVSVNDVAAAMVKLLADPSLAKRRFTLCGPEVWTLGEIVRYTARQRGQRRLIVPLPGFVSRLVAMFMDFVPGKPFSTDNYLSAQLDSVCSGGDGLRELGIVPTPVEAIMGPFLRGEGKQMRFDSLRKHARRDQAW